MSNDQSNNRAVRRSLSDLLRELSSCDPAKRIDLREPILSFGSECVGPLRDLAIKNPDLSASVASWLGVLVNREPGAKAGIVKALKGLPAGGNAGIVQETLGRLGHIAGKATVKTSRKQPVVRKTAEDEVHARIIKAAREGRLLTYSDLETSRGHVGKYLVSISRSEAELGRPPLTSLVVSKTNGKPGGGFLPAMVEIGYAHRGERLEVVWQRAVADVKAYWADRDGESDSGV
jgi:hypothetical protein